ncbi:MAG: Holliday junction resolvase RuvX [Gammaproteobacteria bacterium]|jgi:putative Holliday junction resolvase|nr:Holliday junction resolvase RuvX [Gammaproteobacteria bacterium]
MPEAVQTALGFDFGMKRIGAAVGQSLTGSASPLGVVAVRGGEPDWEAIGRLIGEWRPGALVVGLPYNMDLSEQDMTHRARHFAEQLTERFPLPVHTVDERLSSREAEAALKEQRQQGRRRITREDIDGAAACVILESWFNSKQGKHSA